MGKTTKWIKNFLIGKKAKDMGGNTTNEDSSFPTEIPSTPGVAPPNKRWSFRRTGNATTDVSYMDFIASTPTSVLGSQNHSHPSAVTAASNIRIRRSSTLQDAAATMIQSVFRSYLARKALCALKGLVKLQALVRGHLVRKQAVTTLRCMQALMKVQARTRAQRIQMAVEAQLHTQSSSPQENPFRQAYNMDRHLEDNIRVVEMDLGESKGNTRSRNTNSTHNHVERSDQRYSSHTHLKQDFHYPMSPAPSVVTDMSPNTSTRHFDEFSLSTDQSSPHCYPTTLKQDPIRGPCPSPQPYDHTFFPSYMANTESFKAKARSQSAPKQRLDSFERQSSKKKPSVEGRNFPRVIRMQRSSSQVGSAAQGDQFPWSLKLDRSTISLKESECGSTSTSLTNTNYSKSLAAYEVTNY